MAAAWPDDARDEAVRRNVRASIPSAGFELLIRLLLLVVIGTVAVEAGAHSADDRIRRAVRPT